MPISCIIRPPSILSTPKRLANAITNIQSEHARERGNAVTVRTYSSRSEYLGAAVRRSDQHRHTILSLHPAVFDSRGPDCVDGSNTRAFFLKTKAAQRKSLEAAGIPTVPCATTRDEAEGMSSPTGSFVARPLHHSQGRGWRVTDRATDFDERIEYIQPLLHKRREFRVLASFGEPLVTLRKRVPEEMSPLAPWNHSEGSVFITIREQANNQLSRSGFLERLVQNSHPGISNAALYGLDVIQDFSNNFYVLEVNSCPSLAIEENLDVIARHLVTKFNSGV